MSGGWWTVRRCWVGLAVGLVAAASGPAAELLPWQQWIWKADTAEVKPLDIYGLRWTTNSKLALAKEPGPFGAPYFNFDVTVSHHHPGQYPMGWPSFETRPAPPLSFSGYDALQYWVRVDTDCKGPISLRFILWSGGAGRVNEPITGLKRGEWVQVTQRLAGLPALDQIDRVHFFLCESDYQDKDVLHFQVGGFRLAKLVKEKSKLAADEAACGLWVGERADRSERAVLLEPGTAELPATLLVETGAQRALTTSDTWRVRLHEVFTGQQTVRELPLPQAVAPGTVARLTARVPLTGLAPGYYLAVSDLQRDGRSLLGGRVGCDDFYVKKPGETMAYTVLSVRAGMCQWVRDLLHGDFMGHTRIALPHVYDPLDPKTYGRFLQLYTIVAGKHTEGNEAGDTGLVYAAQAFRAAGDTVRCKFVEGLLEDSLNHMMNRMQAPSGATITWANELADNGVIEGRGGPTEAFGSYDSNQIGEWIRPLAYAMLYYRTVPGREDYARRLSAASRRAAEYLVRHSTRDSDGLAKVVRHLHLSETPDGQVKQVVYQQEGRQCDVYLGRALAGVSYYAYAMQVAGEQVPEHWWPVLDNTVRWSARKMKPNGWFDWQCADIVEGGCHTFLGNIYIGEGLFGCYLADRRAGRAEQAKEAAEATRKAYRYVTDDCYIKGQKYEYPLEFWVGPYVYWLFQQYLDLCGPDAKLTDWLTVLDRRWSAERGWHDFLDRAPSGGCGRTETNGMLVMAIMGYLGLKQMATAQQPWVWEKWR